MLADLCCEECGLDLSNYDNIDSIEAEHSGAWIQVILQCQCGAAYMHDLQLINFESAYGGKEHAVIRFVDARAGEEQRGRGSKDAKGLAPNHIEQPVVGNPGGQNIA